MAKLLGFNLLLWLFYFKHYGFLKVALCFADD